MTPRRAARENQQAGCDRKKEREKERYREGDRCNEGNRTMGATEMELKDRATSLGATEMELKDRNDHGYDGDGIERQTTTGTRRTSGSWSLGRLDVEAGFN